jgi:hypothetical protein
MPIKKSFEKDEILKMMQGFPPAANRQVQLANWREPDIARWSFNHLRQLLPTAPMRPANLPAALAAAPQNLDDLPFLDACGRPQQLGAFLAASQSDCFAVKSPITYLNLAIVLMLGQPYAIYWICR